ncbi:hard surface-induced protein [Colletotrichum plurivorum]|uniref:Hard surface-induced protein n=1 Tax=Colletotrichum plurivorum TaxID=2175906 RepID=A0A8H6KBF9_9PEZI|nr:hard surface-induced protein [Colletotrichum plurivorum]
MTWFSKNQDSESYTALLQDEELGSPLPGSPIEEDDEKALPRSRTWRNCTACSPKDAACFAGRTASRVFWTVLPSFISRLLGHGDDDAAIPEPNATSYLNGLRGLASLAVAFQHNTDDYFFFVRRGWGQVPGEYYIIQLPFVRLLTSGVFMVAIFFVISGFALTYGPLRKSHAGAPADAIGGLPSSVFRRPFRLFLPVIPVLIATDLMIRLEMFYVAGNNDPAPAMPGSLWAYAVHVWNSLVAVMAAGNPDGILPQGWTLAAEFKGSLLVFLSCLALARTTPRVRMPCVAVVLVYLVCALGEWQQGLFLSGMLLADMRHVRDGMRPLGDRARTAVKIASWLLLVFALWLGGFPVDGDGFAASGFGWLRGVPTFGVMPWNFFESIAAVCLVAALENLPGPRGLLDSKLVLYLGEISYGLYLVHWACGKSTWAKGTTVSMMRSAHDVFFSWAVGFAIAISSAVWVADVHWRMADRKSVRFAHWLGKKLGV